jgi:hypothetical protein
MNKDEIDSDIQFNLKTNEYPSIILSNICWKNFNNIISYIYPYTSFINMDDIELKCPLVIIFKHSYLYKISINCHKKYFIICYNLLEMNRNIIINNPNKYTYKPITIMVESPYIKHDIKLIKTISYKNILENTIISNIFLIDSLYSINVDYKRSKAYIFDKFSNDKIEIIKYDIDHIIIKYKELIKYSNEYINYIKNNLLIKYKNKLNDLLNIQKYWNNTFDELSIYLKKNKIKIIKKNNEIFVKYTYILSLINHYYNNYCNNNEFKLSMIRIFLENYYEEDLDFDIIVENKSFLVELNKLDITNKVQVKNKCDCIINKYNYFIDSIIINAKNYYKNIKNYNNIELTEKCTTQYFFHIEAYKIKINNILKV